MHLNSQYVRHGDLDLQQLFTLEDGTDQCKELQNKVEQLLNDFSKYKQMSEETNIDLGMQCFKPYECAYWKYCSKHLPTPNVFDIANTRNDKKVKMYQSGVYSFRDALDPSLKLKDKQLLQIQTELNDLPPTINKDKIKTFLNGLSYPIYYLDFEKFQQAIPQFDGDSPYAQISFQYHYTINWKKTMN